MTQGIGRRGFPFGRRDMGTQSPVVVAVAEPPGLWSAYLVMNLDDRGDPPRQGVAHRWTTVVVVAAAAGAALASFWPMLTENVVIGLIDVMVVVTFTATGLVLCEERDQRATGSALVLAGFFYLTSWWWSWPPEWQVGPVGLISYVFGYLWFVLGVLALLRYPEPELARWWDRAYVALLAFWVVVPKVFLAFLAQPEWVGEGFHVDSWWPSLFPDEMLFDRWSQLVNIGLVAVAVPVLIPLLLKIRRSRSIDRIEAVPGMAAAGTVMICGSAYLLAKFSSFPQETVDILRAMIGVAALFTPIAFLSSALRRRLARASLADLIVRLVDSPSPRAVQDELRRSLPDPTLAVWFWLPERDAFVDIDDTVSELPPDEDRFRVEVRTGDGSLLAALMLDPALRRHANLVAPAVAACRFALENSRMHADLRAQLTELQESASRIAQAELIGRRKIERDLHDGAQQTLWSARMSLGEARQKTAPGTDAYKAIRQAQSDLGAATEELRQLARGISQPILTQSGLRPALEGVVERLGVKVTGSVLSERLEPAVENTAYFVACEAITNAVKHAGVAQLTLEITRTDDMVTIRVEDVGPGGAKATPGSGLAGIRDRAKTIGGRMTVDSPQGAGTRILVTLPCG